jgi:hypothetical protein
MENDDNRKERPQSDLSRREMLKGAVAGVASAGLSAADPTSAAAQEKNAPAQPVNRMAVGRARACSSRLLPANAVRPEPDEQHVGT